MTDDHQASEQTETNEQLRREVEQGKRTARELAVFQQFAEASGRGFGIADMDGRVVYVNPALCRMLGEERPEDLIGKPISAYHPEGYHRTVEEEIKPALSRQPYWEGEQTLLTCQGRAVPTLYNVFLIRDENGTPYRLGAAILDLTERKKAEEALRQSEEIYRTLVQTSPDALIMSDLEGHVIFASPRAMELYGSQTVEELIGRNPLDFVSPEDHPKFFAHLQETIQEGVSRQVEYTFVRKDGTRYPGEVSGAVVKDASGKPIALMALVRDITQRRQAEEALQREHRTLEHLLRSSDRERQLIAYEIHDGLAQQLAGAIMQLQTYAHLKDAKPREAARAYDAGMTMLHQGHLEARRLISGVRPPILDESGVVAALAHLVNDQGRSRGPQIEFLSKVAFARLAPALENAIYRIAQEGLTNACRHSRSEKVQISLRQRGPRVRIEIRDWGTGFAPKKRLDGEHYGLEGIRERARLLGGRSAIRSRRGQGTRIIVELPLVLSQRTGP